jgi:phosphoesterase RecJ-like protein
MRKEKDLAVTKFILNNYHSTSRIAYYILTDEDLNNLGINREEGSNYVNTLANIEEFEIWVAITENRKDHNVRVSLRSREVPVNTVANAFHGGGHALASGATLASFDELPELLESLKDAIKSYHNQG